MNLISENKKIISWFKRCIAEHEHCSFATAWASVGTMPFEKIVQHREIIEKSVIGTHFYQTHPDVLEIFVGDSETRFVLQPNGVFHPKCYVFWSQVGWDALVGSANLTNGAMTVNTEVMLAVSSKDTGASHLKDELLSLIHGYWQIAEIATQESAERYRAMWKAKQKTLERLAGKYWKDTTNRPPLKSSIMSLSWNNYFKSVKNDAEHGYEARCGFLEFVRSAFLATPSLKNMDIEVRKCIAGKPSKADSRWAEFGSMKGAGRLSTAINTHVVELSEALDIIPLYGPVSRFQYNDFIKRCRLAFPEGGVAIATFTRLIAMKRPDQFFCYTDANEKLLREDVGVPNGRMTDARYWDEFIEPIRDSPWWQSDEPTEDSERAVWRGRVAMLDAIFYRPKT